jgi:hypothetical protein
MIVSELKPLPEVLGYVQGEKRVFIVSCKGCAEACHTGDEPQVLDMKQKLEQAGKVVTGYSVIDFLCDKSLIKLKLLAHEEAISSADSLLVMTCGVGIQATASVVNKPCHPACNTINLGGSRGKWVGSERCRECGDCLLDWTGGICPLTACTKQMLNGPCGGAKDGKCEFEGEVRDCGWHLIYERLKQTGRLDKMKEIIRPKDFRKLQPPKTIRSTIMWALEQEEKAKEVILK